MVGTKSTRLKVIKNNNLKLTNLKKIQVDNKEFSWILEIIKIFGIGALAALTASIGQAWASAGLVAMGVSEVGVGIGAAVVGSTVEFLTLTGFDALQGNTNTMNLLLNALSFARIGKVASTELKMKKALDLAEATGLFKQLGIKANEIKSYKDLIKILNGRKIVFQQTIFDFTSGVNRADILSMFSTWSTKSAVSKISRVMKKQRGVLAVNLDDLINLQNILTEINPKLFPRIQSKYWKEAKTFMSKKGYTPKDLLSDEKFAKIILTARTSSGNVSGQLVWALYSLRLTKSIDMKVSSRILRYIKMANKKLSLLDLQRQLNRVISSVFDVVTKPLKKVIVNVKKSVAKKVDPMIKGISKSGIAKATFKNIDKLLIPIESDWILGYKVQPLPTNTYTVMIYFKNHKYQPRIFYWNYKETIDWVNACAKSEAGEFYKRNLELGYHLKNSSILGAINFLPAVMVGFIKEGLRTWNEIRKLNKVIASLKNDPQKYIDGSLNNAERMLSRKKTNFIVSSIFSSVFFRGAMRNFINDKSNKNYFRDSVVKSGVKKSNSKIKKIRSVH